MSSRTPATRTLLTAALLATVVPLPLRTHRRVTRTGRFSLA